MVPALVFFCLTGAGPGVFAFVAEAAPAAVITVNTLTDEATSGNGLCSLREAITNANNNAQTFPECAAGSGPNAITFSVSGTITLGGPLPAISDDVTIDGGGQNITISGNNSVRAGFVNSGKTVTLHSLAITNGLASSDVGGGIFNAGGTLNVIDSTFSDNSASFQGGGIFNDGGTVSVTNSTFSGNTTAAFADGGGIFNANGGTVNVTNSTFSGNSANFGGGIFNDGTLNLTNTTFSGNTAGPRGGGVYNSAGTLTVANSTFSGNSAAAASNKRVRSARRRPSR